MRLFRRWPRLIVHTYTWTIAINLGLDRCISLTPFIFLVLFSVWVLGRVEMHWRWEEEGSRVVGGARRHRRGRSLAIPAQAQRGVEGVHRPIPDTHLTYSTRGWPPGDTPLPRYSTRGKAHISHIAPRETVSHKAPRGEPPEMGCVAKWLKSLWYFVPK